MAGLGIGPEEFAIFSLEGPEARASALARTLAPRLQTLGESLCPGLSRVVAIELHWHVGKGQKRKGLPPSEMFIAFSTSEKGYRTFPHLLLAVTAAHLHARVAARTGTDRHGAMRRALEREASALARKGKPFRKLRSYETWSDGHLPEIAPAHSAAFWSEQAEALAGDGVDLGVCWPAAEARSLSIGDVLGAFRDLAPLFKILANAA